MNSLDVASRKLVVSVSPIRQVWTWAISYLLSQISSFDQVGYLLFQLKTILSVMSMILMELTILVLVPSKGVSLDLPRPLYEVFILDLHKYLGSKRVKGRQHKVRSVRWSSQTLFINLPSRISFKLFTLYLPHVISPSSVRLLSL